MNLAFQLLRDYTYPDDEGIVDMTNIYKVLYTAGEILANTGHGCTPITTITDSAISSYAFSDFLGHTYNCEFTMTESGGYGNSTAYRDERGRQVRAVHV